MRNGPDMISPAARETAGTGFAFLLTLAFTLYTLPLKVADLSISCAYEKQRILSGQNNPSVC